MTEKNKDELSEATRKNINGFFRTDDLTQCKLCSFRAASDLFEERSAHVKKNHPDALLLKGLPDVESVPEVLEACIPAPSGAGNLGFIEVANLITREAKFAVPRDTEEVLIYKDGLFLPGGEVFIKEAAKRLTGGKNNVRLIADVIYHISAYNYCDRTDFNEGKGKIFLRNGIYSTETKTLEPNNSENRLTSRINVDFVSGADCPKFKKFIGEVVDPSDIPVIQEVFGYCLLRDYPIQKAVMLVGEGSNGKSVLISTLADFLGKENTCSIPLQELEQGRFSKAGLYEKYANLCADLSDVALVDTGTFKAITGGDQITAERKFGHPFQFVNFSKQIFSANKVPESKDQSDAYFRRWTIITFPFRFSENGDEGTRKANPHVIKEFTTPEEKSGMFNWALEGLERLLKEGKFSNSKTTEELREHYTRLSDSLGGFVMDCIVVDSSSHISKDAFMSAYCEYCKEKKIIPKSKISVGRNITLHIAVESGQVGRVHSWKGIKFKGTSQDILDSSLFAEREGELLSSSLPSPSSPNSSKDENEGGRSLLSPNPFSPQKKEVSPENGVGAND